MLGAAKIYVTRDSRAGRGGKEWGTNKIHGVLSKFPYGIRHKTCQNKHFEPVLVCCGFFLTVR